MQFLLLDGVEDPNNQQIKPCPFANEGLLPSCGHYPLLHCGVELKQNAQNRLEHCSMAISFLFKH